jgi:hypothetical protein
MAVIYGPLRAEPTPYLLLNRIANYLRDYITTDLRNENFFSYNLDGTFPSFITDGGNDMFDNGNYTAPWLLAGTDYTNGFSIASPPALNYSNTTSTLQDTNFYYVSLGYSTSPDRRPLTVLGSRSVDGTPVGFQKAGNIGADGGGNLVSGDVYTGSEINGFTTHAYYRQTYGQSTDPAICDLYMLLGHANWGTTFGSINKYASSDKQIQGAYFYASGSTKNVLAIATLLSRPTPSVIPLSAVQTVVTNYTLRIKEALNY